MALKFNCPKCDKEIIVKLLKTGETAECRHCGADVVIPADSIKTDEPGTLEIISLRKAIIIGAIIGLLGTIIPLATILLVKISGISLVEHHLHLGRLILIIIALSPGATYLPLISIFIKAHIDNPIILIFGFIINQGLVGAISGYLTAKLDEKSRQSNVFWFAVRVCVILIALSVFCIFFVFFCFPP